MNPKGQTLALCKLAQRSWFLLLYWFTVTEDCKILARQPVSLGYRFCSIYSAVKKYLQGQVKMQVNAANVNQCKPKQLSTFMSSCVHGYIVLTFCFSFCIYVYIYMNTNRKVKLCLNPSSLQPKHEQVTRHFDQQAPDSLVLICGLLHLESQINLLFEYKTTIQQPRTLSWGHGLTNHSRLQPPWTTSKNFHAIERCISAKLINNSL